MKTQYLVDGVLVRPLESLATNFLSCLYYNGQGLVDLLSDVDAATRWFSVMTEELGTAPGPDLTDDDLAVLRNARGALDALYSATIHGDPTSAASRLNEALSRFDVQPRVRPSAGGIHLNLAGDSAPALDNFIAEVLFSALFTLAPPQVFRLHKCDGPRCVLYYTKGHSRQHWCSSTCGNRARVARHAEKVALESRHDS